MTLNTNINELELSLKHFDSGLRNQSIKTLAEQLLTGNIRSEPEKEAFNLHCHTFFSYNAYGYSPSGLAWLAKQRGYKALGIVDFDTLDGVSEFLDACEILGVRGSAGLETRVYIPEFATREINSPGEPGVCYHIGIGFTSSTLSQPALKVINDLRQRASQRNRDMVARINAYLDPVVIDYDHDVLSLTPSGNATERHILMAYTRSAESKVADVVQFWAKSLNQTIEQIENIIKDNGKLHNLIRTKLMKRGGVGYIQPGPSTFPTIEEVHQLIIGCDALPCFGWLDGTSAGELAIKELLEILVAKGVVTVNIIPDRNWNIADVEQRKIKTRHLFEFVQLAQDLDLPVNVGTEMNSPGQKLVDDFAAPEIAALYPVFLEGARFIFGHTMMQRANNLGYQSNWAQKYLPTRKERNVFYSQVGRLTSPGLAGINQLKQFNQTHCPQDIIDSLEKK